jgi:hypothetical protein
MGEWGHGEADAHQGQVRRAPVAVVILYVAQVVTVLMIIGGLGLVVWMHLWSQQVIAAYPVKPDNDVTRGFFIGMVGGLGIAGLSVIALVGLTGGRRWGGVVDVFQWALIWLPFAIGLRQFTPDAYAISTAISLAGALVGALAFITARRGRIPEASSA